MKAPQTSTCHPGGGASHASSRKYAGHRKRHRQRVVHVDRAHPVPGLALEREPARGARRPHADEPGEQGAPPQRGHRSPSPRLRTGPRGRGRPGTPSHPLHPVGIQYTTTPVTDTYNHIGNVIRASRTWHANWAAAPGRPSAGLAARSRRPARCGTSGSRSTPSGSRPGRRTDASPLGRDRPGTSPGTPPRGRARSACRPGARPPAAAGWPRSRTTIASAALAFSTALMVGRM